MLEEHRDRGRALQRPLLHGLLRARLHHVRRLRRGAGGGAKEGGAATPTWATTGPLEAKAVLVGGILATGSAKPCCAGTGTAAPTRAPPPAGKGGPETPTAVG